jgi:hypothetical protein
MPAPVYSVPADTRYGVRQVVKFGGLAVPIVGGVQSYIDIMDGVSWFLDPKQNGVEIKIDRHLVSSPYLWRAKSALQSDDYYPVIVTIPLLYDESSGTNFQTARAPLFTAGTQNLTFDNATGLQCRLNAIRNLRMRITSAPYLWEGQFEFIGYEPFWKDFNTTTQAATPLTGSTGAGTSNPFTITNAGNFWAEPVFTFFIPNTNAAPIAKLILTNTTSGEALTIAFGPNLTAGVAWTLTIDCGAMTVTDQNGVQYDFSGSFPLLYPPAGTVNSFTAVLVTGSGASSGVTLTPVWTNRWVP